MQPARTSLRIPFIDPDLQLEVRDRYGRTFLVTPGVARINIEGDGTDRCCLFSAGPATGDMRGVDSHPKIYVVHEFQVDGKDVVGPVLEIRLDKQPRGRFL